MRTVAWKRLIRWARTHRFIAALLFGISICAIGWRFGYYDSSGNAVFSAVLQVLVLYALFRAIWPEDDASA